MTTPSRDGYRPQTRRDHGVDTAAALSWLSRDLAQRASAALEASDSAEILTCWAYSQRLPQDLPGLARTRADLIDRVEQVDVAGVMVAQTGGPAAWAERAKAQAIEDVAPGSLREAGRTARTLFDRLDDLQLLVWAAQELGAWNDPSVAGIEEGLTDCLAVAMGHATLFLPCLDYIDACLAASRPGLDEEWPLLSLTLLKHERLAEQLRAVVSATARDLTTPDNVVSLADWGATRPPRRVHSDEAGVVVELGFRSAPVPLRSAAADDPLTDPTHSEGLVGGDPTRGLQIRVAELLNQAGGSTLVVTVALEPAAGSVGPLRGVTLEENGAPRSPRSDRSTDSAEYTAGAVPRVVFEVSAPAPSTRLRITVGTPPFVLELSITRPATP